MRKNYDWVLPLGIIGVLFALVYRFFFMKNAAFEVKTTTDELLKGDLKDSVVADVKKILSVTTSKSDSQLRSVAIQVQNLYDGWNFNDKNFYDIFVDSTGKARYNKVELKKINAMFGEDGLYKKSGIFSNDVTMLEAIKSSVNTSSGWGSKLYNHLVLNIL